MHGSREQRKRAYCQIAEAEERVYSPAKNADAIGAANWAIFHEPVGKKQTITPFTVIIIKSRDTGTTHRRFLRRLAHLNFTAKTSTFRISYEEDWHILRLCRENLHIWIPAAKTSKFYRPVAKSSTFHRAGRNDKHISSPCRED